jgi:hypothetical protein
MSSTLPPTESLARRPAASASTGAAWSELVAAMPIVIFYRAAREVLRRRAHRLAVLQAFRR